jgi:hypothetical protein
MIFGFIHAVKIGDIRVAFKFRDNNAMVAAAA